MVGGSRARAVLVCEVCESRNYTTSKRPQDGRLRLKKFCPTCGTHTNHLESK